MALSKDRNTKTKFKERVIHGKVAAAKKIYAGALLAWNATGYLVPLTDAAGLKVAGRAEQSADNTDGDDGDLEIDVATGVFEWEVTAAVTSDAQAAVGQIAYGKDDQTIGYASDTANDTPVGIIEELDAQGRFWVSTGRRFRDEALGDLALLDSVGAAEIDAAAVGTAELADAVADQIMGAPGFTIAAEGSDAIAVSVQAKDAQGNALAIRCHVTWWIADASYGAPSGDPPSAGSAVTTGTALKEHTAEVLGESVTDATGLLVLTFGEAAVDAWYLMVSIGGRVYASNVIQFA